VGAVELARRQVRGWSIRFPDGHDGGAGGDDVVGRELGDGLLFARDIDAGAAAHIFDAAGGVVFEEAPLEGRARGDLEDGRFELGAAVGAAEVDIADKAVAAGVQGADEVDEAAGVGEAG
jgi:hypothetical protein